MNAAVDVDDVRRTYYEGLNPEQMWWWIRAMRLGGGEGGNYLIVDDDEGGLYRVPFSVADEVVEFGDAASVKIQYVDAPDEKAAAAFVAGLMTDTTGSKALFASRAESRPQIAGGGMDPKELRESLGLPEDATDEDVEAAQASKEAEGADETPPAEPSTGTHDNTQTVGHGQSQLDPEANPSPASNPPPLNSSAETVTLDRATFEQLKRNAAQGAQAFARQETMEKDRALNEAIKAGKFPPARKEFWSKYWDQDPDGAKQAIAGLAAGLVPVNEHGVDPPDEVLNVQGLPESWFPEIEAEKKRSASRVTQEAVR